MNGTPANEPAEQFLADESVRLCYAPDLDLSGRSLDDSPTAWEVPVLRPVDLKRTKGVVITDERIDEMIASYDPAVEQAALNFDHEQKGPSLGWCTKLWREGGMMWARFENLSAAAVDAIRSGHWKRRSAEILMPHPDVKRWYFSGLAMLGAERPAVSGLPEGRLLSGRPVHIVDLGASAPAEDPMEDPNVIDPPAAPSPAVTETEPAPVGEINLSTSPEQEELLRLRAENARLRQGESLTAARSALDALGARVTPAMRRIAEPLLAALRADEGRLVQLAASAGHAAEELDAGSALLALLAAAPEFTPLGAGEEAPPALDPAARLAADSRTDAEREFHRRHGMTDERYLELAAKFPLRPNVN